jgi:hypothetical protein
MKTLTGALLALVVGATLGAVTVVGIKAASSDSSVTTTSNSTPAGDKLLDYGSTQG